MSSSILNPAKTSTGQSLFPNRLPSTSILPAEVWEKILRLVVLFKGRYYVFDSKLSFDWKAIDASRVCKLFNELIWYLYPRDYPLILTSKTKPGKIMA
jgi:hypothetical protein